MSFRKNKSPMASTNNIRHSLNFSKTKTVFSFDKSDRFPRINSHSPNKFYNMPSSLKKTAFSITKGCRYQPEKPDFIPPTKYTIISEFDKIRHARASSEGFGISREVLFVKLSLSINLTILNQWSDLGLTTYPDKQVQNVSIWDKR